MPLSALKGGAVTGQKLLQYVILEKLGEGGMGVVYKARDTHLGRFVAIKVLPPRQPRDPERRHRFAQEAKAASALNHPNIVTIHDINQADGIDFICMEYIAGKTLDNMIPRRGLPLNQALQFAVQIADALSRSHAAGIVHRDLKPSNVMVDDHGLVKILDFGVAKLTEPIVQGDDEPTLSLGGHTQEGKIVGTPTYMSPEQVEGKAVDPRSDIFSFGSLMYEMFTGQAPFRRDSQAATMAAILREEPRPINEVAPGIPREVERIVKSCLRKDVGRRLQHMDDVKAMLQDVKEESESGVLDRMVIPERRIRWRWWAALAGAAVIALGGVVVLGRRSPPPQSRAMPLTSHRGFESDPSFAPDGNQVVFAWNGEKQDNQDIYIGLVGDHEGVLRVTTDPAEDFSPAWSPDQMKIAFLRKAKDRLELRFVSPMPGSSEVLLKTLNPKATFYWGFPNRELAWADRTHLVYFDKPVGEDAGLFLISIEDGRTVRITTCGRSDLRDSDPAFSPKDGTLAFVRISSYSYSGIYLQSLTKDWLPEGAPKRIWNQFQSGAGIHGFTHPTWTADGRTLVVVDTDDQSMWRLNASGKGDPEQLPYMGDQIDISRREPYRLLFRDALTGTGGNIGRIDLSAGNESSPLDYFAASTEIDNDPQFSSDGARVLFASKRGDSEHFEIWICNADGTHPRRLTHLQAKETASPRWSPDDRYVVFDSDKEGHFEIYSMDVDGGEPKRLNPHEDRVDEATPAVSADGKTIYFSRRIGSENQIWRMPAKGGPAEQVTKGGGFYPVESNGFLYYEKQQDLISDIWRVPVHGGEEKEVLGSVGGRRFAVRPNGIYYVEWPDSQSPSFLRFLSFATGEDRTLKPKPLPGRYLEYDLGFAVSPDGRTALLTHSVKPTSKLAVVEHLY
jgi:eukaryotic-like serine/threonine-protein kinase